MHNDLSRHLWLYITGMSGVGKSTICNRLISMGVNAIDLDYGDYIGYVNGVGLIDCDKVVNFVTQNRYGGGAVFGCAENQREIYGIFDIRVMLDAELNVMLDRVAYRSSNAFGKSPEERDKIIQDYHQYRNLIMTGVDLVIRSDYQSVKDIAERLYSIIIGSAQQVDSAEASTIAVPPSDPSGSPR